MGLQIKINGSIMRMRIKEIQIFSIYIECILIRINFPKHLFAEQLDCFFAVQASSSGIININCFLCANK